MQFILNADDFGKSPGRNEAVDAAFRQGLISSAGLIVTGKYVDDAVRLMREGGYEGKVHIHFNLSANLLAEGSEDAPLSASMRNDPFFCRDGRFLPYSGLPRRFSSIIKWRTVYRELVAQYERFITLTDGKGDYGHVDFHLWYNLTWPVAVALRIFTRKYKIRSVRYIGVRQKRSSLYRLFYYISRDPRVKNVPSTNIDYFLSKRNLFSEFPLVELYCHPHFKEGVFLDDSPSYLKHERQPMMVNLQQLKDSVEQFSMISWERI